MLIKLKRARTHIEDRHLALCLATSAGLLNAMALGAFGMFPSHMSGNISQISSEVNRMNIDHLTLFISIISAFVVGSVTARMAVIMGIRNGSRTIFSFILIAEGLALVFTSFFETFFFSENNNREVILLLAFLMGAHNSTSTQLSNGRVRSTHITGTLTDAGISIGSVLLALLRRDPSKNVATLQQQLNTHLVTIFSFLGGGIIGLLLFNRFGFSSMTGLGLFLVSVAALSVVMTVTKVRRRAGHLWRSTTE